MSQPLSFYGTSVPLKQTTGQLSVNSVGVCRPRTDGKGPSVVPIRINWSDYINAAGSAAPANAILVNLTSLAGPSGNPIDAIRSIKIDNIGGLSPVTVFFPDTGDEVICAADSTTISNVYTGNLQFLVFSPLNTGNLGRSVVVFCCNFEQDAADIQETTSVENLEQSTGSPFSLNTLSLRAIGDRYQLATLDLTLIGVPSQIALFGGPPNGYNSIRVMEVHFKTRANYTSTFRGGPMALNATIVDDLGTAFFTFNWYARNDLDDYSHARASIDIVNLQRPLNATIGPATFRKYFLQNNVASVGFGDLDIVYTLVNTINF